MSLGVAVVPTPRSLFAISSAFPTALLLLSLLLLLLLLLLLPSLVCMYTFASWEIRLVKDIQAFERFVPGKLHETHMMLCLHFTCFFVPCYISSPFCSSQQIEVEAQLSIQVWDEVANLCLFLQAGSDFYLLQCFLYGKATWRQLSSSCQCFSSFRPASQCSQLFAKAIESPCIPRL